MDRNKNKKTLSVVTSTINVHVSQLENLKELRVNSDVDI